MGKGDRAPVYAPDLNKLRTAVYDGQELPSDDELDLHHYRGEMAADFDSKLEDFLLRRYNTHSRAVRIITGRGGNRKMFKAVAEALTKLKSKPDGIIEAFSPENSSANGSFIIVFRD
jgi:DNA-nicking Smr family endonuclease